MKVAVLGANGQLGRDVADAFLRNGDDVISLTHEDLEVSSVDSVVRCIRSSKPELLVNTTAMHHVERCEQEAERAFSVNAVGPRNLSLATRDIDVPLVHISTDYVFDGGKACPYEEEDLPSPLNVYGASKLAGEQLVRAATDKHFVLRTSALYGVSPCRGKGGLNFVRLMLKLAGERDELRVVDNEVVSPTSTAELAAQIVALSRTDCYGLFHATAEGSCSWFEFAKAILSMTNARVALKVASPEEFPTKVRRPAYSVLENRALKRYGLNRFRSWQSGLSDYLATLRPAAC
jgi:dTDP-4-dehydrorhamnose reductase